MTARVRKTRLAPATAAAPAIDWLAADDVARVIDALRRRRVYRDDPRGEIRMVQTHFSSVFLTPAFAFKFKRPVDLGFADFRRLARRRHFCREELRLNRRLAADVYLDVLPLGLRLGRWTVGADAPVLDYMVVMRRLPEAHMMDAMVRAGTVGEAHIARLARLLARFHARPPRKRNIADFGAPALLRENWDENFRQVEPYIGRTLDRATFDAVRARVEGFMAAHGALLAGRVREGRIRDGHGDLRCEHILLEAELRIIDCIEFNERFRYGDVANDLAFLLMDLVALGRPDLGQALLG
ncbi:MAG TPA: phosphotransferase, partial [bacterium]